MKKPPCLPSDEGLVLLLAALAPAEQSLSAWQEWRRQNSGEVHHYKHERLLPLLSRRLAHLLSDQQERDFLRGLYRYHWTRTQLLSNCAAEIVGVLQKNGVDTLILKGLALVHLSYRDLGVRPMHDFDVLVRPSQRDRAVALLEQAGWQCQVRLPDLSATHGCEFRNLKDQNFDLHWFSSDESRWPGADEDLWSNSVPLVLGPTTTRALNPTYQLLHVMIHGVKVTGANPCVWVTDACTILDDSVEIEWAALLDSARRRRVVLQLALGLGYLKDQLGRSVPDWVLQELRSTPVNWVDRLFYQTKIRGGTDLLAVIRPYLDYMRSERPAGVGNPRGFLRFLRRRWSLQRKRHLPGRIWDSLRKRFSRPR